jgi:hypothetical protein
MAKKSILEHINQYVIEHGSEAKARLCLAVGKSENTLNRWIRDGLIPDSHHAFKLALACGIERKEALRMAREESLPEVATETA